MLCTDNLNEYLRARGGSAQMGKPKIVKRGDMWFCTRRGWFQVGMGHSPTNAYHGMVLANTPRN